MIGDEDIHRTNEKNALGFVTGSLAPGPLSPTIVARGLTWFFWHDDNRGVELIRKLPHEQLTPLLRGMRDLEPEEWTDQRAVHALFVSLGLSPTPLDGKGGEEPAVRSLLTRALDEIEGPSAPTKRGGR